MTINDILNDRFAEDDLALSQILNDWDERGLLGCSRMEYHILSTLASDKSVNSILELGPGKGASTEVMLRGLKRKNKGLLETVNILPKSELLLITDASKLLYNYMSTDTFFKHNRCKFDLIFIDANHGDAQSHKDIENSLKLLTPNGFVACHDLVFSVNRDTSDISRHVVSLSKKYNKKHKMIDQFGNGIGLIF